MAAGRISPQAAKSDLDGGKALLVCAYDSTKKFEQNKLRGAISLNDFQSRLPTLAHDQEIIFY